MKPFNRRQRPSKSFFLFIEIIVFVLIYTTKCDCSSDIWKLNMKCFLICENVNKVCEKSIFLKRHFKKVDQVF